MNKLTDFYAHKAAMIEKGEPTDPQWELLEDKLDNAVRLWINKEVDAQADSVFSYTTAEDVRLCIDMLNASPAFRAENTRKHNFMSAALRQYLLFIEEWEKK